MWSSENVFYVDWILYTQGKWKLLWLASTETGDFLAPDLGGTNLRVLYLKLEWRISSMKDVYTIHEKVDTSGKVSVNSVVKHFLSVCMWPTERV